METVKTTISKSAGKGQKRVELGEMEYLLPTLAEFGIPTGTEVRDEEGNLDYEEKPISFVWSPVCTALRAALTNRLKPQSVEFKDGQKAWSTVEELITSAGGAKGAHFTVKRDFKVAFDAYVASLGKSAGWTSAVQTLALLPNSKSVQPALAAKDSASKKVFAKHLSNFIGSLSEADQAKFSGICTELAECCETVEETLDDE